jgi:hypothetical protein
MKTIQKASRHRPVGDNKTVDYGMLLQLLQQLDYVVHDPSNNKKPFCGASVRCHQPDSAAQQQHQGGFRSPLPATKDSGNRALNINTLRQSKLEIQFVASTL